MTAQSTTAPFATPKEPMNWGTRRSLVGVLYLAIQFSVLIIVHHSEQIASILESSCFVGLGAAATVLAFRNARSFAPGQTARRAWTFIAIMPMADAVAYAAFTMGDVLGTHSRSAILIGIATALLSVTRIMATVAFVGIVRLYRKTGLHLYLRARDYLAMVLVTALEVIALLFSSSGARASGGPELQSLVLWLSIPLVIALAPCSVLGVIIWRYTTIMGGGLVAKAWRANLLYGAAWLTYIALNAVVAYFFVVPQGAVPVTLPYVLFVGADWILKGSEYLIFLGASYQYEACTGIGDLSYVSESPSGAEFSTEAT